MPAVLFYVFASCMHRSVIFKTTAPKSSPNTSLKIRIFIPKAYWISAERIPGALAFLQYVDTLGPGFLDGTFD
jgi:hypothetical protein